MTGRKGFTLIEILIAVTVVAIIMTGVLLFVRSTAQVAAVESTILTMDDSANRALQDIADTLRPAILPITHPNNPTYYQGSVLNTADYGFGRHGADWLAVLREGAPMFPFTVPVDADGDGDMLIWDESGENLEPELGIDAPDGHAYAGAAVNAGGWRLNSVNGSLANVSPLDYGLEADASGTIDLSGGEYAQTLDPGEFLLPDASSGQTVAAYAILRFVPYRDAGGNAVLLREAEYVSQSRPRPDLNGDGDSEDVFALGHIEIVYPGSSPDALRSRIIGGPSILLQLNRDGGWIPPFKLVRYKAGSASPDTTFDEDARAGSVALLVRLLMCDSLGQRDPVVFTRNFPSLVRRYETVVQMRNMGL